MSYSNGLIEKQAESQSLGTIAIAGYSVVNSNFSLVRTYLLNNILLGSKTIIFFANPNFCIHCTTSGIDTRRSDLLLLNDGIALDLAAKIVCGHAFVENLNGTDFWPRVLLDRDLCKTVFLVGGGADVVARAAANIEVEFNCQVAGFVNGYEQLKDTAAVIQQINACAPDVVLVALGNPLQEKWILEHVSQLDCKMISGVGALLDFLANEKLRAPAWVQAIRCEWLFRLALEPKRLFKRYTIDTGRFFIQVIKKRGSA